ncbi:PREDICTED: serine palmitoyltransferase 2 isoform X2 [Ceratosolen solmsi marchali]|nr:PREDICTED: serine palmitoyltransferase 2 isoform X2 [Ceratosolen solmsi marchali]
MVGDWRRRPVGRERQVESQVPWSGTIGTRIEAMATTSRRTCVGTTLTEISETEQRIQANGITSRLGCRVNNNGYAKAHPANGHPRFIRESKDEKENRTYPIKLSKYNESFEKVPFITAALTHFGFYILMFLGFINQLLFTPNVAKERKRKGYAPLYENFEQFYLRYVYRRVRDCWNRPICSVPGATVVLKDRTTNDYGWTFEFTGTETKCINLGSYNYLGFAESTGPCAEESIRTLKKFGCSSCSSRLELGSMPIHNELEQLTARFLGVEDAIVFGMGFATNTLNLPSLVSAGSLVLSDEKNHASVILGLRLSGAIIRVFKHNNVKHLEDCLKKAILLGQQNTGEPWKKIIIVVEGIYSMEGSIVHLPEILKLKKKYKAYLYLDEAHSTGAIGKRGRGICDYYDVDPREVDILMGTFTKSFGSAGGYIAGTKVANILRNKHKNTAVHLFNSAFLQTLINYLRVHSHAHSYAMSMSPPIAQQIITSMKIIAGEDGTDAGKKRTKQLARNTRYFRRKLNQIGVITYGNENSPVVPMLVYLFSKIG